MTRIQKYLLVALAIQIGLIFAIRSPWADHSGGVQPHLLIPEFDGAELSRIELSASDGEQLTLVRRGEDWILPSQSDFPADRAKIDEIVDTLRLLKVRNPVAKSGRYRETFEVDESNFQSRMQIFSGEANEPWIDLIFGSAPSYRVTYTRRAESEEIYEVSGISTFELRPDASLWFDKDLLALPRDSIQTIRVVRPGENPIAYVRSADGWADDAGDSIEETRLAPLLDWASAVRLTHPAGARNDEAQGFANPAARVEIGWVDELGAVQATIVLVGGESPDHENQRFVTRELSPYAGTVWSGSLDAILGS